MIDAQWRAHQKTKQLRKLGLPVYKKKLNNNDLRSTSRYSRAGVLSEIGRYQNTERLREMLKNWARQTDEHAPVLTFQLSIIMFLFLRREI